MSGVMRALGGIIGPARKAGSVAQYRSVLQIRPVLPDDALKVSILQTTVFEQPNEARLTIRLRDEGNLPLEMAAYQDGRMVGHIGAVRMIAPEGWLALLPSAVLNDFDSPGLRIEMITALRRQASAHGAQVLISGGDPSLYSECGFYFRNAGLLRTPFSAQHTGLCPLVRGALETDRPIRLIYPKAIHEA